MKTIILLLSLCFSFQVFAATEVEISVNGMVCGFCAQGISKKFSKEPAVDTVKVSLENKLVVLKLRDKQDLSDVTITNLLKDSGYAVSKIERK